MKRANSTGKMSKIANQNLCALRSSPLHCKILRHPIKPRSLGILMGSIFFHCISETHRHLTWAILELRTQKFNNPRFRRQLFSNCGTTKQFHRENICHIFSHRYRYRIHIHIVRIRYRWKNSPTAQTLPIPLASVAQELRLFMTQHQASGT